MAFRPAKVHTQQHIGPVLSFSTAGARLNIEKRAVTIHLTGKHPAELERLKLAVECTEVARSFFHQ